MNSKALAMPVQRRRITPGLVLSVLGILLLVCSICGLTTGAVALGVPDVLRALWLGATGQDIADPLLAVVTVIRLPRLLGALAVGGALAVAGASLQGLFRNPLADPALIGVSSGAALGAVFIIVAGSALPMLAGPWALPLAASLGGLLTTCIVYRLGRRDGQTDVATLLLAGIAINSIAGAGTGLLTYFADNNQLRSLTFWLLGSLGSVGWQQVWIAVPIMLVCSAGLCCLARPLNAFLMGENVAHHLGYSIERVKVLTILLSAISVGAAVSISGVIGFVGLVVPHVLRLATGANHRLLLPAAALLGGAMLLAADTLARTIVSPAELPIGILTALLGGPFFLFLLVRYRVGA